MNTRRTQARDRPVAFATRPPPRKAVARHEGFPVDTARRRRWDRSL